MNTYRYSDEMIGQYLLGALSEEETERLDELSVADDEFVVRLDALENDLVDAYVRGELEGQTLERFNSYYLSSPRRSEKVRFARAFQDAADRTVVLEMESERRRSSDVPAREKRASGSQWLRRFFFPRPVLVWGAACAALLVVIVGLAVVNLRLRDQMNMAQSDRAALEERDRELQSRLTEERSSALQQEKEIEGLRDKVAQLEQRVPQPGQPPFFPERPNLDFFVLSPQTRGIGQIATLPVAANTDLVALQLELEAGDYPSYRAELRSFPNRLVVWSSGTLRARTKEDLRVLQVGIRPAVLRSQTYILEVTGVSATGAREPAGSYSFRVEKK